MCFGLLSVETKIVGHDLVDHRGAALLHPQPYLLAVTAISGLLFAQTAFRIAPLSVALPIIDTSEPLIACILAVLVLHERFGNVPGTLVGLAAGSTCLLAGVTLLDTSPLVRVAHFEPPASSRQRAQRTGCRVADFAKEHHATMIIIGAPGENEIAEILDAALTSEVVRYAECAVHIVAPADEHQAYQSTHSVN